jgi:hypothetical protein
MASVKIDLGFGEQAILSERTVTGIPTAKHQLDAEEFLRRWPRTRSIQQARDYLRQLGLHMTYKPPGVNSSDTIALLRSAVKSGTVMVAIERVTTRFGAGGGAPQSTAVSRPIMSFRQSIAEMAAGGSSTSATVGDAVSPPAAYSWLQCYDDVSADDLIKYIESVIGRTTDAAAAPATDLSTPLGDAEPFDLGADPAPDDLMNVAARGVSEADEAECYEQYERDMDECMAYRAAMGGVRFMDTCSQRAFMNYQQCRGY